jgi:FAD/FMN-containing dehydrogenase/Fe-S oxidoreductase
LPLDIASARRGDPALAARLKAALEGEVLFDAFSRGRYATDASIYQIDPLGVVVPRDKTDVQAALSIAREEGVTVLPRGGGTSQCGQTVGPSLVLDCSKYMNGFLSLDVERRKALVQPGLVLDTLNKELRKHGLWFPVDISTGSRATLGGMTANNSCGARSLRYGNMVHNVAGVDAILADGTEARMGWVGGNLAEVENQPRARDLVQKMRALHAREKDEIDARIPKVLRKVGGYNIDMIAPEGHNMASLMVGSEGTLAFFSAIELDLQPIPKHRALGICHFPTFYGAMESTRHIVKLGPTAVELVDRTMIELSREIAIFRATVEKFVKGEPEALLLVEFAGDDADENLRRLRQLVELIGDLGFPGGVVEADEPAFQNAVWEVRKQGLNIMMSMKGDGKPISFIEDCAVRLEDLAEYTDRLTNVFRKHGTWGTWYAHASVGTLHVRPVINLKQELEVKKMRAIAEEAFAMVREYKGSHSGEHGDGLVRSEFHEKMFGTRIVRAFEEVKREFDPGGVFNPGKIVHPPKMDDRSLFRFKPGHAPLPFETALDWSDWGGFDRAAEMCNNNGECRKASGVMCPSFQATGEEQHLTRGRANTLRLALTGQLGEGALASDEMKATLDLCLSCKGCKRECPTGVDMARMKLEFLHHYRKKHPLTARDRLIAYLPRYAPIAARLAPLMRLRKLAPGLAERLTGFTAKRDLPDWHAEPYTDAAPATGSGKEAILFIDTFTRWFEPENARAAERVLSRAGYSVKTPHLCCGRTLLSAGLIDEAKAEARRTLAALAGSDAPVVGLEPSCLLTLRDEYKAMLPGAETDALAGRALLLEEFLDGKDLPLKPLPQKEAVVHGHCHQKAFGTHAATMRVLGKIPGLTAKTFESTCCGMAGSFGYEAEHYDVSMKIGELGVLPAMRAAPPDALLVAAGTSCRHQIRDGAGREAVHLARVLDEALQ